MGIQVTIKEVDDRAFRELKAAAAKNKMTIGSALNLAIRSWLWTTQNTKGRLSKIKSWDWGPGTERLSEQADKVLYGD